MRKIFLHIALALLLGQQAIAYELPSLDGIKGLTRPDTIKKKSKEAKKTHDVEKKREAQAKEKPTATVSASSREYGKLKDLTGEVKRSIEDLHKENKDLLAALDQLISEKCTMEGRTAVLQMTAPVGEARDFTLDALLKGVSSREEQIKTITSRIKQKNADIESLGSKLTMLQKAAAALEGIDMTLPNLAASDNKVDTRKMLQKIETALATESSVKKTQIEGETPELKKPKAYQGESLTENVAQVADKTVAQKVTVITIEDIKNTLTAKGKENGDFFLAEDSGKLFMRTAKEKKGNIISGFKDAVLMSISEAEFVYFVLDSQKLAYRSN
jgi:hypothetical protein